MLETLGTIAPVLPAGVQVRCRIEGDGPVVMADPVQMHQVLLDLCLNARDALEGQGTLSIDAGEVEVVDGSCASCGAGCEGLYVELAVQDDGPGIPPELLARVFDPFVTFTEVGKGTGLGLSRVHGIVHEHGGHLLIETGVGKGTRFRVLLPRTRSGEVAAPRGAHEVGRVAQGEGEGRRLLLVEDERPLAELLTEVLVGVGYDVTTCTDPVDALHRLQADADAFDLLLTDRSMPKLGGADLAEAAHRVRPSLPVVMCTGAGDEVDADVARRMGIHAVLRKPVDSVRLRSTLLALLHQPPSERIAV